MTYRHRTESERALIANDLTDRFDLSLQEIAEKHGVSTGPVRHLATFDLNINLQARRAIYDALRKKADLERQMKELDDQIIDATECFFHAWRRCMKCC